MFALSIIFCSALAMVIHELGHLLAARSLKISCSELGLGLGPKLLSVKLRTISFSLRVLPLGSFVRLDGTALKEQTPSRQLYVHLAGIVFNLVVGFATYGTTLSWINLLVGFGNLLPLYQHDGWKCGVVILRTLMRRKSQPAEWALTFSGGFVSVVIGWLVIRALG
jgi:membrane-associated protease RseP (regulator of RpoE activity)